ncbi:hypothetical protein BASA81_001167 [Batrachochytrium salamandrivorans]|nr:hypothetical protein BASA81_001167 [Batrachochytrium salamandrivorans]
MNVSSVSGVKIYDLSQAKSAAIANNLLKPKKRIRSYTNNKIDLLQDFSFPSYSRCVRFSRDGRFILTSGGYKPRIKMYDVQEVSLKFERYCDSDIEDLEILSEDYSKFVLLSENRTLEFHTKFGVHEIVKIPHNGRSLSFDPETSDLYVATNSNLLQRFNLTEGRFRSSLDLGCVEGANCVRWNANHRLISTCGEDGILSLFDPRTKTRASSIQVSDCALTVVEYMDQNGLNLGVGDGNGKVSLFDLRSANPWKTKQHMYETKINSLCFTSNEDEPTMCISLDNKQIKGWSVDGKDELNFNLESSSAGEMAKLTLAPQTSALKGRKSSGLIMVSGNCTEAIQMFFVPSLGPAPVWARYLESVTEELEVNSSSIGTKQQTESFDNFRFVTKAELEDLNMSSLIGSKELKPWMHGYFMEATAFEKLKQVMTAPSHVKSASASSSKKKQKDEQRIQLQRRVRTNAALAERVPEEMLTDDRFKDMFSDPDFNVNESSAEFRLKHPNRVKERTSTSTTTTTDLSASLVRPDTKSNAKSSITTAPTRKTALSSSSSIGRSFLDDEVEAPSARNKDSRSRDDASRVSMGRRLAMEAKHKVSTSRSKEGDMSITFVPKSDSDGKRKSKKRHD